MPSGHKRSCDMFILPLGLLTGAGWLMAVEGCARVSRPSRFYTFYQLMIALMFALGGFDSFSQSLHPGPHPPALYLSYP